MGLMESILLVTLVYFIFIIFFYKNNMDMESVSSYECGFEMNSFNRMYFSYRFFLVSILFIIFDVEISLMLPVPFLMESELGMCIFFQFMLVLIIGLMYEYSCGSLDWLEIRN